MTKTVIAKPIIPDQYWILTDGRGKIGNLIAEGGRYEVKIDGSTKYYSDLNSVVAEVPIVWDNTTARGEDAPPQCDWPTDSEPHNVILDIKRKLQLFTKHGDSKCYYAAGYYNMEQGDRWTTVFCPKYIYIQRYPWTGPYSSEEQAAEALKIDKYNNG